MSKLVVLSEGFSGRACELKVDKTTIGRVEDNAFQIAEPSVSSHHCEILLRGNDVIVNDLNSTNGTFVNGEKVTGEAPVKPGQILRLGSVELRLETEGMPPVAATPAPAAAAPAKPSGQTKVIQRGVKVNELETGKEAIKFDKNSPFAKKTNKTNVIFITIGAILIAVIIVFLAIAFLKTNGAPGQ